VFKYRSFLLAATALAATPAVAFAQAQGQAPAQGAAAQPPAAQGAPGAQRRPTGTPQNVEGVVVTGSNTAVRSAIDRNSYSVAQDLQATTGSISDALKNVPSVQVDAQGNISLRGDASVQIMIDGKPSAMFEGEGRAQALEQLPADQIERVEVLTNPSASIRADGAGGIINLVTKRARRQEGYSGSVRANFGDAGRQNGGISGSVRRGKLTLAGDLSARHMGQKMTYTDDRARLDAASGAMIETHETGASFGAMDMVMARLAADYDIDPKTRISGEVRAMDMQFGVDNLSRFERENAAGQVNFILDRFARVEQERQNLSATGTYRRKFEGDQHELVAAQTFERTKGGFDLDMPIVSVLPAGPNRLDGQSNDQEIHMARTKVDYTRPTGTKSQLKTGFELQFDDADIESFAYRGQGATPPLPDATRSYDFLFDQTIASGYVTYQQPMGKFTVLGGLRLEQVTQDLQLNGGATTENDYLRAYPSLHVSYPISDDLNSKVSYSRRIQRPGADDLNPFVIYTDEFNRRSGNPNLKPQITDAYELEFQYRKGGAFYMATAYYRDRSKEVTDVTRILPGGLFLSTKENLGDSRSAGLEVVANGRLTSTITYNVSGNLGWNEVDGSNLGFTDKRSDAALSGRANVNWQVTPKDFVQLNGFMNGKRLTPQGYMSSHSMLNLGYRHKFTDRFSVVFTAQDILDSMRMRQVVDTPTLQLDTDRKFKARGVHVGFTYAFGGSPQRQRDPGFDFGAGGPPGN
jgi:outer membrane receptor protein involved in Fe transport